MPGEKCRLGAGCVNGASPVLRGFGAFNWTRIKYCDTTTRNQWQTVKTNRILNPKDTVLLARRSGLSKLGHHNVDRPISVTRNVRPLKSSTTVILLATTRR